MISDDSLQVADEQQAPLEAQPEPEVDWKAKYEEESRARAGILNELREQRQERQQLLANQEALRQAILQRQQEPQYEEEEPLPDPSEAPVEYLDRRMDQRIGGIEQTIEQWRAEQAQLAQQAQARMQQEQAIQQLEAVRALGYQAAERAKAELPDYGDALAHAINHAKVMLRAQGVPEGPAMDAELYKLEVAHNARCLQQGLDPAREAYKLAQQVGYQAKAKAEQAAPTMPSAQQPRQPKSLSAVSTASGRPGARITVNDFVSLPAHEQARIANDPVKWRQINTQGYTSL